MNGRNLSIELAKSIGLERQQEAAKHRLVRQIEAGQPPEGSPFGLHIGRIVMIAALLLNLRRTNHARSHRPAATGSSCRGIIRMASLGQAARHTLHPKQRDGSI
jgi:hypothetical protein